MSHISHMSQLSQLSGAIIIDDKYPLLGAFSDVIEKLGLKVYVRRDFNAACRVLRRNRGIELVVLGSGADVKDCLKRLAGIRAIRPGVKVLVAAPAAKGIKKRLRLAGANSVIEMPFPTSDFRRAVLKLLFG